MNWSVEFAPCIISLCILGLIACGLYILEVLLREAETSHDVIDWGSKTAAQLDEIAQLLLKFHPSFVWEVWQEVARRHNDKSITRA